MQALSQLSYGPYSRISDSRAACERRRDRISGLLFLLDRLADDVGHVGVAFFLLFDEGGIVEALVNLDFFFLARRCGSLGRRLLALLFGLGVLERNKFSVCGLRLDADGFGTTGAGRAAAGSGRARDCVGTTIGTTLPV